MLQPAAKRASCTSTDSDDGDGLPNDVLIDILHRLPCRSIAQSRTICRAWRALVDDNGLLPRFFSSRFFPGVFTNHTGCQDRSYFLAAPAAGSRAGDFRRPLFSHGWAHVKDHCNGLLLLQNDMIRLYGGREETDTYVCNPVTVRCDAVPRPPAMSRRDVSVSQGTFLAFDPAVSLHYEVYKVLRDYYTYSRTHGFEEPKTTVVRSQVYSSQTGQWEMRQFVPGRCTAGHRYTIEKSVHDMNWPSAEYWRGSLYVVGLNGVLMILHCLDKTYDSVQLPGKVCTTAGGISDPPRRSLLASYEKGIHYAEVNEFQLKVWALAGLGDGQVGWTMLHDANLVPYIHSLQKNLNSSITRLRTEWEMVRSSRSIGLFRHKDNRLEVQENEVEDGPKYPWDSDEDSFIDVDTSATNKTSLKGKSSCGIIGLHPHKGVLLLNISGTAVAYHFATSRMQCLSYGLHSQLPLRYGLHSQHPLHYGHHGQARGDACAIASAFTFRPCYDDVLPTSKIPCPPSVLNWWKQKHRFFVGKSVA